MSAEQEVLFFSLKKYWLQQLFCPFTLLINQEVFAEIRWGIIWSGKWDFCAIFKGSINPS